MDSEEFRVNLLHDLRSEIDLLKSCQTQTVTFGLTGAGVMLTLTNSFQMDCIFPFLLLMPLLALLPFWTIFFDKARTISRIIGFIRVQERFLVAKSKSGLIGWEMAMKLYRTENKEISPDDIKKANDVLAEKDKNIFNSVYWLTVYTVFCLFSIICLIFSLYMAYSTTNWVTNIYLTIICMLISCVFLVCIPYKSFIIHRGMPSSSYSSLMYERHKLFFAYAIDLQLITAIIFTKTITDLWGQIFMVVFWFFFILFLFVSNITLWEFQHLVGGRYTYNVFERRWGILINYHKNDQW